ncbi:MAG: class I SAM-dependent methyltransferase [Syntrophaceae bacterium]|nr:class I SAM-dependent methyltransferase [Syntrophaceae bacterium]
MELMPSDEIYRERKRFFNDHAKKWAETWRRDRAPGSDGKHGKDFERLFAFLPLKPGDHVLDAGCGTGVLVPYILERITSTGLLYELDYAERMIAANKALHGQGNIRFIVSDVEKTRLEGASCDAVICFSSFPHFHDREKAASALSRVLKPQGVLALSHFGSSEGVNRHHGACHAVMHDLLPGEPSMRALLGRAGLDVDLFIDEPGFYFLLCKRRYAEDLP